MATGVGDTDNGGRLLLRAEEAAPPAAREEVARLRAAVAEVVKAGRWEAGKSTDRLRWVRTGSGSDYRAIVKRLIVKRLQSDCKAM